MSDTTQVLNQILDAEYAYGRSYAVDSESLPPGLSHEVIRQISAKRGEPDWMLSYRLQAYEHWLQLSPPTWWNVELSPIDYDGISYYSAPIPKKGGSTEMGDVDPALIQMFEQLGVPMKEREVLAGVAVDAVLDSTSVATSYQAQLRELGILFCSMQEAIRSYPELVRRYLGSIVPYSDNYFAALNAAVFSDGSFCYIPRDVRCPIDLSTYFRINSGNMGQFERTLIIAEPGGYVSYLEGCTAAARPQHQLHSAVVELWAGDHAEIRYATVQNWYPGSAKHPMGGVYNLVTKRGLCAGERSSIHWTQVEVGSAVTCKYPSCVLQGRASQGSFYSISVAKDRQQTDTGSKMIHIGAESTSRIVSKSISAGCGKNTYRGLVKMTKNAENARNFSQCDSLLIGPHAEAYTLPYFEINTLSGTAEHEATIVQISGEQLVYCAQRRLPEEKAFDIILQGYLQEILGNLPMEFLYEAQQLIRLTLAGSIVT